MLLALCVCVCVGGGGGGGIYFEDHCCFNSLTCKHDCVLLKIIAFLMVKALNSHFTLLQVYVSEALASLRIRSTTEGLKQPS